MSLLQTITSQENYDRRSSLPPGDQGRRMSFNPVGTWVPPAAQEEPIGAYEVSPSKRIAQVLVAVVYCLFGAGIVFGYAAIKPVLIKEQVYRKLCTPQEIEDNVRVCYEQELRLNFMFTVAAVSTNVVALPLGTVLDKYGPRVCGIIGSVFITIGCLFMTFAWDMPIDGYIPGYLFLALGGPCIFISSFQLSNTFPRYSGLILALLTGAFDTSSAIFLFYRLIYSASHGTFWPKKFFSAYIIVPVLILIAQIFLMPANSYKTVGELVRKAEDPEQDEHDSDAELPNEAARQEAREARKVRRESIIDEVTALLGSKDASEQEQSQDAKNRNSGVYGALHGHTAWEQICTPWFVLITLFTIVQMTRINYFVATIRPQYEYILRSYPAAVRVNQFFDVALPLGGVFAVPFIGLILDNTSTPFVLGLLVTAATTIGVLGMLPYTWAAYANVVLFVLYRPLYYTTVSDYAAKVFGFATFGKVYGLIICLAGLGNFSQSVLDALTHGVFENDPVPVNFILLLVALTVGVALVGYVGWRSRSIRREMLEQEAQGSVATARLLPVAE